ncbi:hypothetical protein E4L96_04845 [Massilia arenosa]|uniref:ABC transporter substrate-binding protein n=1 Tax=Zemynaea arenosa TaxID=2561931 RepID=A0A4Y9SJ38_9BURK|nr:hypothetical protein [Massilia arenosa]TFW25779.1 hypothetical protein E4L96_04845 [Massilia arenosa]
MEIEIVTADDSNLTRRIAEDLRQRVRAIPGSLRKPIAVTIGPVALRREVTQRTGGVILSAYTSSQVWHAIGATQPGVEISGVYAEPNPADQLGLVALLYRRPVRVAAILSSDAAFFRPLLPSVSIEPFGEKDDINKVLNRMAQTQVLLALPDRAVFTTENVRNILLSTYRHGQGVIGFSADMVKSGALATTFSDLQDINIQLTEIIAAYALGGDLPPPQFPRYFRTIVNEGVARSLNLALDDGIRHYARRPVGVPR